MCGGESSVTIAEDNLSLSSRGELHILRDLLLSSITSDQGLRLLAPLRPRCATILYLHRFAVPDLGVSGHDPAILSQLLEYLRRRRYNLMSVMEVVKHIDDRIPLRENAVVFTVDDGYSDFNATGASVFAAYDCPVTVFLVTDFVSGRLWNWFDRVAWAFEHSSRKEVALEIRGERLSLKWKNSGEGKRAGNEMVERLKRVADSTKDDLIGHLAQSLDVEIPTRAPEQYRAMSWDQVRACAARGCHFRSTHCHPSDSVPSGPCSRGTRDNRIVGGDRQRHRICSPGVLLSQWYRR